MTLLSKDQILAAADLRTREVAVPDWGGSVRIRELTVAGEESVSANDADLSFGVKLVAACVVDADGQPMFTPADAAALREKSARVFKDLVREILALNDFTREDAEDLEGNGESGSPSGSA